MSALQKSSALAQANAVYATPTSIEEMLSINVSTLRINRANFTAPNIGFFKIELTMDIGMVLVPMVNEAGEVVPELRRVRQITTHPMLLKQFNDGSIKFNYIKTSFKGRDGKRRMNKMPDSHTYFETRNEDGVRIKDAQTSLRELLLNDQVATALVVDITARLDNKEYPLNGVQTPEYQNIRKLLKKQYKIAK